MKMSIDWRTVATLILLDVVTYVLVYWLLMPLLSPAMAALNAGTTLALGHVITALRLGAVGTLAARARRKRRGLRSRGDLVPSLAVGGLIAFALQLVVGTAVNAAVGAPQPPWGDVVVNGVEWVVFPLLGLLFVQHGPAATAWRRPTAARSTSWSGGV